MTAVETPERTWDDVRAAWEAGGSLRECAAIIGVSHELVRQHAENEGWEREGVDARESAEQRKARTAAAVDAARLKWANRRSDEADAAGVSASIARQKVIAAMDANDYRMTRAAVGAYMVFIDKAQLLSGGATSRAMLEEELFERADRIWDELAERRRAS